MSFAMAYYRRRYSGYRRSYRRSTRSIRSAITRRYNRRSTYRRRPYPSRTRRELKSVTAAQASFEMSSDVPKITLLNGMQQGVTGSSRIGRRVQMKEIELRGQITADASSIDTVVRVVVVYDADVQATTIEYVDLFDDAQAFLAQRKTIYMSRFRVLFDQTYHMRAQNAANTASLPIAWKKRINLPIAFNDSSGGTVGDIESGVVYLISWGSALAAVVNPKSEFSSRISYTDA